jgi:hypothetical protein
MLCPIMVQSRAKGTAMQKVTIELTRRELVDLTAAYGQYIKKHTRLKRGERPSEMAARLGSMRELESRMLAEYAALGPLPGLKT